MHVCMNRCISIREERGGEVEELRHLIESTLPLFFDIYISSFSTI
jgi:hypothetical protein